MYDQITPLTPPSASTPPTPPAAATTPGPDQRPHPRRALGRRPSAVPSARASS